jgi:hypothetical protein
MTDDRDFDRIARAWLEIGPNEAPDRAVAAVLEAAETTPQVRPLPQRLLWRFPMLNRLPIAAYVAVAVAIVVGGGLLLLRPNNGSGIGGATQSPSPSPSVAATPAPTSSPTPTASPSPTQGVFTSDRYGYTISLPAPWRLSAAATATWDGTGSPAFDAPFVDVFVNQSIIAWVSAAPTKLALADFINQQLNAATREHPCDTGSQTPEKDEPITVGGEPARLLTIHCGILILSALTIHNGSGVGITFQSPFGNAAEDAADRVEFLKFLDAFRFAAGGA